MAVVKLDHGDLARREAGMLQQLRTLWQDGQLCDVVLKSCDGTEHRAHANVLCSASSDLKNMLLGSFLEAGQVQRGKPVEMAASKAVVNALLEYVYGGHPHLELEDALELLQLADAYNFSELKEAVEVGLHNSLDGAPMTTALKVLQETQSLHDLKAACEEKVAANFEECIDLPEFLALNASQFARILQREDLRVSREEVVLSGLLNWMNRSKDRSAFLGVLLRNVDFQALASNSLARLRHLSASMGANGHDLQREVDEASLARRKRKAVETFRPKRRCLQNWSPALGASAAPRKVLPWAYSMCCHEGAIYCMTQTGIRTWKPGQGESCTVDTECFSWLTSDECALSVSPEGKIFAVDVNADRLMSFQNGSASFVLGDVGLRSICCSPNGVLYLVTQDGRAVQRLVGNTLEPLISCDNLPAELQFDAFHVAVTKEEVVYVCDAIKARILRKGPSEVVGPVVARDDLHEGGSFCVTEDGKFYLAQRRKVWTFHLDDATWTEVLELPKHVGITDLLVQGKSLYVSRCYTGKSSGCPATGVYEYFLPEFQFE